jgi:hypothetical protein
MKSIVWQNVTEGPMNEELRKADIVCLSEVSLTKLRIGRPWPRYKTYHEKRVPGLAINWNRSEFKAVKTGFERFHGSGKHEHWDGIATPARGVLWVVGYWKDDPDKRLYGYWVTWFLNSWKPMKGDHYTSKREWIVEHLTIPKVEQLGAKFKTMRLRRAQRLAEVKGTIGGGDTNSLRWNGRMLGFDPIWNKGLDRVWTTGEVQARFAGETDKTGTGPNMYHNGIKIKQKVRA